MFMGLSNLPYVLLILAAFSGVHSIASLLPPVPEMARESLLAQAASPSTQINDAATKANQTCIDAGKAKDFWGRPKYDVRSIRCYYTLKGLPIRGFCDLSLKCDGKEFKASEASTKWLPLSKMSSTASPSGELTGSGNTPSSQLTIPTLPAQNPPTSQGMSPIQYINPDSYAYPPGPSSPLPQLTPEQWNSPNYLDYLNMSSNPEPKTPSEDTPLSQYQEAGFISGSHVLNSESQTLTPSSPAPSPNDSAALAPSQPYSVNESTFGATAPTGSNSSESSGFLQRVENAISTGWENLTGSFNAGNTTPTSGSNQDGTVNDQGTGELIPQNAAYKSDENATVQNVNDRPALRDDQLLTILDAHKLDEKNIEEFMANNRSDLQQMYSAYAAGDMNTFIDKAVNLPLSAEDRIKIASISSAENPDRREFVQAEILKMQSENAPPQQQDSSPGFGQRLWDTITGGPNSYFNSIPAPQLQSNPVDPNSGEPIAQSAVYRPGESDASVQLASNNQQVSNDSPTARIDPNSNEGKAIMNRLVEEREWTQERAASLLRERSGDDVRDLLWQMDGYDSAGEPKNPNDLPGERLTREEIAQLRATRPDIPGIYSKWYEDSCRSDNGTIRCLGIPNSQVFSGSTGQAKGYTYGGISSDVDYEAAARINRDVFQMNEEDNAKYIERMKNDPNAAQNLCRWWPNACRWQTSDLGVPSAPPLSVTPTTFQNELRYVASANGTRQFPSPTLVQQISI